MAAQSDARPITHMGDSIEISYRFPDAELSSIGACLSMSGSGIVFRADQFIERGKALEVSTIHQSAVLPSFVAYVEVTQSNKIASGQYEVATEIKGIKEK
ncbi:MAG: PilZ domain-containing protein [Methyloprofundus sp.]|nr:PilZ domain-containing protein [Methyloprofundus sp.]